MDDHQGSMLGREVDYPEVYAPELLEAIPRQPQRERAGVKDWPFFGTDFWTAWELSWLDADGKPHVAVLRLEVPGDSPAIVESKSLKLYLNSFYQTVFRDPAAVRERIAVDLSARLGSAVAAGLLLPADWGTARLHSPPGDCLDDQPIACRHYQPAPELLASIGEDLVEQRWYSHLLRSRCPVTGQPDWATLWIDWHGPRLDTAALLQYVVSFRQHQDFHEQCVERIFLDLWRRFSPQRLLVGARYLRRGGIDINPVRSSEPLTSGDIRLFRQ